MNADKLIIKEIINYEKDTCNDAGSSYVAYEYSLWRR